MSEVSDLRSTPKTEYFSGLALSNMDSMRLLRDKGLLRQFKDERDIWRNVTEHALVQHAACVALGEKLGLSNESLKKLSTSADLHDGDKLYQSQGLKAINSRIESKKIDNEQGGKEKYYFFEESEAHSVKWMKDIGISDEVIKIASSDGHPAIPRIMSPDSTFEERMFHYIGSIVDGGDVVPLDKRIDNLEQNFKYKEMNEYGRSVKWTDGRTLYQTQRAVGHQIELEIVGKLLKTNIDDSVKKRLEKSPNDLPIIIKEWVEANYTKK